MEDLLKQVVQAVSSGDWRLVAALGLMLLVAGLRWGAGKLGGKVDSFLNSDAGASLLVLATGYGATLVASRGAGMPWSWSLARSAAEVAFTAAGGYSLLKRLAWPLAQKLYAKIKG